MYKGSGLQPIPAALRHQTFKFAFLRNYVNTILSVMYGPQFDACLLSLDPLSETLIPTLKHWLPRIISIF